MSRVLVTGGAGTIGAAVVRRLLRRSRLRGPRVRPAARRPAGCARAPRSTPATCATSRRRGARSAAARHVIHLAAIVGGIANFHKLPFTLSEVNHALYNAVFRAAIDEGVERFTYVSSSMVFENAEEFPTPEDYLPRCPPPRSAYGWSKLAGEVYCRAAHDEFGLPFTICRPFNAYGPGELPDAEPGIAHAVPDLIRKSLARLRPLPIFGSGEQTRTLTHVDDIADGIVTAMAHPAGLNEDFNISASEELTVAQIARICWEACGNDPDELELEHLPSFEVDVQRRWPSVEKAERLLGWRARIGVREGIEADWPDSGSPRALITGITGQDGSYLAELLLEKGYEVHGMVRRSSTEKFERIEHLRDRITLHQGDLLDQRSLVDALRAARPDEIYNLAAMSFVAVSWIQPTLTAEFTGVGVTRMLEAMREACPEARFYQASSSEMFGKVREIPQTEATPFYPRSPYGVAKAYGHHITVNYRESYGLFALLRDPLQPREPAPRARVRDAQDHLARGGDQARAGERAAARQPRRAARLGLREGLRRGDVADAPAGRADDYVIATGETHTVRRVRRARVRPRRARLASDHVVIDEALKRPAEVDMLVGDAVEGERVMLGWAPRTSFEELIDADGSDAATSQLPRRCAQAVAASASTTGSCWASVIAANSGRVTARAAYASVSGSSGAPSA